MRIASSVSPRHLESAVAIAAATTTQGFTDVGQRSMYGVVQPLDLTLLAVALSGIGALWDRRSSGSALFQLSGADCYPCRHRRAPEARRTCEVRVGPRRLDPHAPVITHVAFDRRPTHAERLPRSAGLTKAATARVRRQIPYRRHTLVDVQCRARLDVLLWREESEIERRVVSLIGRRPLEGHDRHALERQPRRGPESKSCVVFRPSRCIRRHRDGQAGCQSLRDGERIRESTNVQRGRDSCVDAACR